MALNVGELYAKLTLDRKPFDAALSGTESSTKGWASRIGGVIGGAGKAMLAFGAIGGAAAAAGIYATASAASDLNETLSKVNVVFGEGADEVTAWGANAAQSMGMSQNAALGARATLGNLFVSMGVGEEATMDMSGSMVELAGDLASFNNMDPTEVLEKLRSGLVGEAEPLRALGVNISAATIEAKAMELGLGGVGRELTAAEKAQASYALIMEQTTTAQGDFANTSGGMANQQRILAATITDAMASIGQAFVPIIQAILPQVTAAFQGFAAWIVGNMPTIQAVAGTVIGAIGTILSTLGTIISTVIGIFVNNGPQIGTTMATVGEVVRGVVAFIVEEVMPALIEVMSGVVEWVTSNWPTISSVLGQVFGAVAAAVKVVWPILYAIGSVLFPWIARAAGDLLRVMDFTFKAIGGVINVASNVIRIAAGVVSGIWNALSGSARAIWGGIQSTIATIVGNVSRVVTGVFRSMGAVLGGIWRGISAAAGTVWRGIVGTIKGVINGLISVINGFIRGINSIQVHIPAIGVGPVQTPAFDWWGVNLGQIPHLAAGSSNFGGGFAMVGERGPELAYLPGGSRVWSNGDGPGGVTIQGPLMSVGVLNAGDRGQVDRLLVEVDRRLRLRTGRQIGLANG